MVWGTRYLSSTYVSNARFQAYISLYSIDKNVILIAVRSHSLDNLLSENRVVIYSDF